MGLPSHPSLEEHWCTLQLTPGKMVMSVVLVSLVAAAAAQEAKPTPLWFLGTTLTGSFKERSNQCKDLLAGRQEEASLGPIFIPETSDAHICIRFPRDTLPETWRHDRGNKGACANGCCEFLPPLKNPPPPAPQPTWFTTESDCSDTSAAITAPTLFQGQELDPKKICFQLEDGSFEYREGILGNCGGPCCIFYGEAPAE